MEDIKGNTVLVFLPHWLIMFPKQDLINNTLYFMSFCISRKHTFKECLSIYAGKRQKLLLAVYPMNLMKAQRDTPKNQSRLNAPTSWLRLEKKEIFFLV